MTLKAGLTIQFKNTRGSLENGVVWSPAPGGYWLTVDRGGKREYVAVRRRPTEMDYIEYQPKGAR